MQSPICVDYPPAIGGGTKYDAQMRVKPVERERVGTCKAMDLTDWQNGCYRTQMALAFTA